MSQTSAYPPGTWPGDPNAPWNQVEGPDLEVIQDALNTVAELKELCESDDALNGFLKTVRRLYDEIAKIKLAVEDGEYGK